MRDIFDMHDLERFTATGYSEISRTVHYSKSSKNTLLHLHLESRSSGQSLYMSGTW